MSDFTPGPWKWIQQIGGGPALVYDDSDGGGVVLEATTGPGITVWNERDRDLIAAAPDMYEALKRVGELPGFEPTEPYGKAVNAALTKAEGKS